MMHQQELLKVNPIDEIQNQYSQESIPARLRASDGPTLLEEQTHARNGERRGGGKEEDPENGSSCGQKRATLLAERLAQEVLPDVPYLQRVFTIQHRTSRDSRPLDVGRWISVALD